MGHKTTPRDTFICTRTDQSALQLHPHSSCTARSPAAHGLSPTWWLPSWTSRRWRAASCTAMVDIYKKSVLSISWYFGNYSNIIQIKKLLLSLWIVYLPLFIDPRTWPNSDAVIRYLRAAGQRGLSRWPVVFLAICFEKIIPIFLLVYMNCKFLKIFHLLYLLVIKHQLLPKPQDLVLGFEEVLGWEKVLYNWNIVALNLWFWRQHPVYRWK